MVGRQGFAVSRKRESHGKNLLCKLTLDGAFSLAIEIRFWLRRVLTSKPSPIEKARGKGVPVRDYKKIKNILMGTPASASNKEGSDFSESSLF